MSGGGGKGGQKETVSKTEIPKWIEDPAKRNLRRAEEVQQLAYMPWYGPHVAAFTPTQNAAFQGNIDAAEAFGLLSPNTLTPTTGMPAPTEFAGGVSGYSAMPLYEQALAELEAKDPGTVAQYNALFGNEIAPLNFAAAAGGGGGRRFRGNAGDNTTTTTTKDKMILPSDRNPAKWGPDRVLTATSKGGKGGRGDVGARLGSGKKVGTANKYERQKNIDKLIKSGVARKTGSKYGFGL